MKKEERDYTAVQKSMREAAWICIVFTVLLCGAIIAIIGFVSTKIAQYISNVDLCYGVATITVIVVVAIGLYAINMHLETINEYRESNFNALVEGTLEKMLEAEEKKSINSEKHDEG